MNKKLLIVVILLIPFAIISFFKIEAIFNKEKNESKEVTVRLMLSETNEIVELPLEEYIIGVIAAEMPASFEIEALKAQAVAARSYAISRINENENYDLINTTANQAYNGVEEMKIKWEESFEEYYNKVKTAVYETENLVITHNNEVITAYYFAMSNGQTEDSELVFAENKDYLKSVESKWDNDTLRNFDYEEKITKKDFCEKLSIDCEKLTIEVTKKSNTNRILTLNVNGLTFEGTKLRNLLGIRSTDFEYEIKSNYVLIKTKGYGHGVGMSQYGANGMAKEGNSYQQILKHYYQNIEIKNLKDV